MGLLKALEVRNFKCFRALTTIDLGQSTYLVGPNDSGKTAVLAALHCFFDSRAFAPALINKTELAAKKEGFNRTDIAVHFDLAQVAGARGKRLNKKFSKGLRVTKSFTWREASETVQVEYSSGEERVTFEELDKDVRDLLSAVSISYIHPQEGADLLQKAQEKFKQRLFHNWGRHASVAERVKDVQEKWSALRTTANSYLSSALSTRLREIWPNAEVKVDLPDRIQDVVAVSDITFRSSPSLPPVTLPSHGTGAQSAILYQTHYILDSDRTLHPGIYFPVWLLEEPESFLHADISLQLARLLSSDEWLKSVQMIISTHSPIVLAASRQNAEIARWVVCDAHAVKWEKPVTRVEPMDVKEIGRMMGDPNFDVYFDASSRSPRVFLEDSRQQTKDKFEAAGVKVTDSLGGIGQIKKYLAVLLALGRTLYGESYFILDGDMGLKDMNPYLKEAKEIQTSNDWKKLELGTGIYAVVLPAELAVEDLFAEWPQVLSETFDDIYDVGLSLKSSVPTDLTRVVSELRRRKPLDDEEAKKVIRKQQDVKDRFWYRAGNWQFADRHKKALLDLLPPEAVTKDSTG